jgi:hypothetical protein
MAASFEVVIAIGFGPITSNCLSLEQALGSSAFEMEALTSMCSRSCRKRVEVRYMAYWPITRSYT